MFFRPFFAALAALLLSVALAAPVLGQVVTAPVQAVAQEPSVEEGASSTVRLIHARLRQMIENAPEALADIDLAVAHATDDTTTAGWLGRAIKRAAIAVSAALILAEATALFFRRRWLGNFPDRPETRIQKICFLATRTATGLIAAAIACVIGFILNNWLSGPDAASYMTVTIAVVAASAVRAISAIAAAIVSPHHPEYRLVPLEDRAAKRIHPHFLLTIIICAAAISSSTWASQLPIDRDAFRLVHIVEAFGAMVILMIFVLVQRRPIASAIAFGVEARPAPYWRKILAGSWHLLALGYLFAAFLVSSGRVLLDHPGGMGLVTSPIGVIAAATAAYSLFLVIIDGVFRKTERIQAIQANGIPLPTFQDLAEHAAAIVVAIGACTLLFNIWGVNLVGAERTMGARFFEEIVIILVAYFAYQATKIIIDRRLLAEATVEVAEAHEELPHSAASRIATLLHLLRGFALATIVVMAVMIALSEIGINIGPLFAGAGVVGLAIGFGAQTLIKDIFSGAFFLIDDAFRRGEYIDIGIAKGTVEKISVRSLQLRHQNGPLDTVPFGAIRNVRNFSRDWVIMKIPLRLVWNTDVEKVRKIVKRIGQELIADPEHGPKFLDPVKSQGIYEMDDAGIIIRVKFKTRPGDQFTMRKIVYARLVQEFALNGVQFSSREVVVRVAREAGAAAPDDVAIAGAALRRANVADGHV